MFINLTPRTININLTPHTINLNDGRSFPASGIVARFGVVDNVSTQTYGSICGLLKPEPDVIYIVSALVLAAAAHHRTDLVAPATGHPEVKRNDLGHIVSVPCFVR